MRIIALCGFIGCGKDTAAAALVKNNGYKQIAVSGVMKDCVALIFMWPRDWLDGRTEESRLWRESVDSWWSQRLNIPHLTPRWVLQNWGTEVVRNHFHSDIWIASLEKQLLTLKEQETQTGIEQKIVISDCRFDVELESLSSIGAKVVHVQRGALPNWWQPLREKTITNVEGLHKSEWSWVTGKIDYTLPNDEDREALEAKMLALESSIYSEQSSGDRTM